MTAYYQSSRKEYGNNVELIPPGLHFTAENENSIL